MIPYISTKDMSRTEWLAARRNGIGGSDAAAIMGQSKWSSPLTVYMDKRGLAKENPDNEAMRQGRDCEEVVAARFTEETGLRVRRCYRMFRHPDYPWMLANIDRQVMVGGGHFVGLECKTTSPFNRTGFDDGDIPPEYYWQCMHYMAVTCAPCWYLAVMVFSTGFHVFRVDRDETAIERLITAERDFWVDSVLTGTMPAPIGIDSEDAAIESLSGTARYSGPIDVSDMHAAFDTLALYERDALALVEKINAIKQSIKLRMGACERASCGRWEVSYRDQERKSIDSKRLRSEQPALYQQYVKTSTSRVLKITEA